MMKSLIRVGRNLLLTLAVAIPALLISGQASALSGSSFMPGRIIDDQVFYNYNAMDGNAIQNFLNARVPHCDTNGTQPASEYGRSDLTHAQYAKSRGWQAPPYTCLRNYKAKTPLRTADDWCGEVPSSGSSYISAATIIDRVSKACHVSPKSLIVTIQKESTGPLVTDTWPLDSQYNHPLGFGCPDHTLSASEDHNGNNCYDSDEGFFRQVYLAAHGLKRWGVDGNYSAGTTNTILWNPNSSCGTSQVYISTRATAALYTYTPYRPNKAALNNLYGTGDSCSAYGNRNFWRIYNDWFGSTLVNPVKVSAYNSHTTERGDAAKVGFSLASKPSSSVVMNLSLSDGSEASFGSPTSHSTSTTLTIDPANWNDPGKNIVRVYGAPDSLHDGDVSFQLQTHQPSGSDATYSNLGSKDIRDVTLTNIDNEANIPMVGDWNKGGRDTFSLRRGSAELINYNFDGNTDKTFNYGSSSYNDGSGNAVLTGDFNGDGRTDFAFKSGNNYYINYGFDGNTDFTFHYGDGTEQPIVGDWNGDGKDTIALRKAHTYYINNHLDGNTESTFNYGGDTDTVLAGDWNANGKDTLILRRAGTNKFLVNNGLDGKTDFTFAYGTSGDTPLAGDWDGNHQDTISLRHPDGITFAVNNKFDGHSDTAFHYGQ